MRIASIDAVPDGTDDIVVETDVVQKESRCAEALTLKPYFEERSGIKYITLWRVWWQIVTGDKREVIQGLSYYQRCKWTKTSSTLLIQ